MTVLRVFVLAYAAAAVFAVVSQRLGIPEIFDVGIGALIAYGAWRWVRSLERKRGILP